MGSQINPPPQSSSYITPAGYDTLQNELQTLWIRRADVVKALAAAAAEGDRSENAEYIYRKKELAGIDRRIRYLQKRLPDLKVVTETPASHQVFFGAWVTLKRQDGSESEYRIVGADEADATRGHVSVDAPLARALLKKCVDDEVELKLESGDEVLVVTGIRY